MTNRGGVAALLVAVGAFLLYDATLLPGLDFGDTASFQTMAGSPFITPRDGYPLYFAFARLLMWITQADPARALNLASALQGGMACGVTVLAAAELSGSVLAGVAVATLLAGSYTFWSQSIIGEVYALHAVFVSLTVLLLLRWQRRQTLARLTAFFSAFALALGNHLSIILLLPAYVTFLFTAISPLQGDEPDRAPWRRLLGWRVVSIAALVALGGALQYAWNIYTLWLLPQAPADVVDALQRSWFDVTKSDWRETMILRVPAAVLADRTAAYWFDLTQQFGPAVPALSALGLGALALTDWRRALLVAMAYVFTVGFAFTYNVGDPHVFYLPSHLMVALACAPALSSLGARVRPTALASLLVFSYAMLRIFSDYPALDRSSDRRPTEILAALTSGLDDDRAILITDLNWQVENGLSYWKRLARTEQRAPSPGSGAPSFAHTLMPDVLLYAPTLIADNRAVGRQVALTSRARDELNAAYGPLFSPAIDTTVAVRSLEDTARGVAQGTRYVLSVLEPTSDYSIDREDIRRALVALTGNPAAQLPDGAYVAVAGVAGSSTPTVLASGRPFRRAVTLDEVQVLIRMDSWLRFDTIRRMGFGHVIVNRRHTLIVERGVSFVAFDRSGTPGPTAYAGNIFAPEPRFVVAE